MSFRARIALVAAAAVAIAVVVASGVVYLVVRDELYGSVDASLRANMDTVQHSPPFRFADGPPDTGVFGGYPQLVSDDGRTFIRRGQNLTLPVSDRVLRVAQGDEDTFIANAKVKGKHVRVITFPSQPGFAVMVASWTWLPISDTGPMTDPFAILIGLLVGYAGAALLGHFTGWTTATPVSAVAIAVGFSAAVGVFFGYYPARKAAALNPIQALRYE